MDKCYECGCKDWEEISKLNKQDKYGKFVETKTRCKGCGYVKTSELYMDILKDVFSIAGSKTKRSPCSR